MDIFFQLIKDPLFNFVLALTLFFLGNLVSYVLFRLQIQSRQIFWDAKTVRQRHSSSPLMINRVIIWNSGLDSIACDDIASSDPLAIIGIERNELIRIRILARNNNRASETSISDVETSFPPKWRINFEYFKKNQGVVLEIVRLHTERTGKIDISGDVINGKIQHKNLDGWPMSGGTEDFFPFSLLWFWAKPVLRRKIKATVISIFTIIVVFVLISFLPKLLNDYASLEELPFLVTLFILQQFMVFIGYIILTWRIWSIPQVPKGLEIYYEESK